jgi:hypothetical protein
MKRKRGKNPLRGKFQVPNSKFQTKERGQARKIVINYQVNNPGADF